MEVLTNQLALLTSTKYLQKVFYCISKILSNFRMNPEVNHNSNKLVTN